MTGRMPFLRLPSEDEDPVEVTFISVGESSWLVHWNKDGRHFDACAIGRCHHCLRGERPFVRYPMKVKAGRKHMVVDASKDLYLRVLEAKESDGVDFHRTKYKIWCEGRGMSRTYHLSPVEP